MEKNKRCLFWGKAEIKRQSMLLKVSLWQAVSVAGSEKWLCSLTSPYSNLHILNNTGNFKEKKNYALFLCRENLISKTTRKAHSILWFLWHSILQNEITKSEESARVKWYLQKWTFPCSEVWIQPFCQILTVILSIPRKTIHFHFPLVLASTFQIVTSLRSYLEIQESSLSTRDLLNHLIILNQKMLSPSLGQL